jgi:glycosyltransferase involved in cell wall biosynthesis
MKNQVIAYSYENPLLLTSGDHVRIQGIHNFIGDDLKRSLTCYYFGLDFTIKRENQRTYSERKKLSSMTISRIFRFRNDSIFGDLLIKLLQLFLDEPFYILQTIKSAKKADIVITHGDMTTAPLTLRLLGFKGTIIFDSLAHYAQTLYMRSQIGSFFERASTYLQLGFYLSNYKLQVRASDKILYPSDFDASNANRMYGIGQKTRVVPNIFLPTKVSIDHKQLRAENRQRLRISHDKIVLVFCAGLRSKANKDALDMLIELENPNKNVLLLVTGPWLDYRNKPKMPSLFLGTVERSKLPGILAASDIGLAPIFEGSGTLLKVLEYLYAGLPIVATPLALGGIPLEWMKENQLYIARAKDDFPLRIMESVQDYEVSTRQFEMSQELLGHIRAEFTKPLLQIFKGDFN